MFVNSLDLVLDPIWEKNAFDACDTDFDADFKTIHALEAQNVGEVIHRGLQSPCFRAF